MKWAGLLVLGFLLVLIYWLVDPATSSYFPACPFHSLTGLQCPGCGSQRAVHHLLNVDFRAAVEQNMLLVFSIPYVIFGMVLDRIPNPSERLHHWKRTFYGRKAIFLVLILICLFWIFRNL